jgi:hypothetical protein
MNAKTASTVLLVFAAALLAAVLFFAGAAWRARITADALALPAASTDGPIVRAGHPIPGCPAQGACRAHLL